MTEVREKSKKIANEFFFKKHKKNTAFFMRLPLHHTKSKSPFTQYT